MDDLFLLLLSIEALVLGLLAAAGLAALIENFRNPLRRPRRNPK